MNPSLFTQVENTNTVLTQYVRQSRKYEMQVTYNKKYADLFG